MESATNKIPNYKSASPRQRQQLFTQYAIKNRKTLAQEYNSAFNRGMILYNNVPLAPNPNLVVKEMNRQLKLLGLSQNFVFVNDRSNIVLQAK
jgi:hypothetical protein